MLKVISLLLVCLVFTTAESCKSTRKWTQQWKELPSEWREKDIQNILENSNTPIVLLTGSRGFRFGQTSAVLYLDMPVSEVSLVKEGEVIPIYWAASRTDCQGVAFRVGSSVRFLLILSRLATRLMAVSESNILLINNVGDTITEIPTTNQSFDLNIGKKAPTPTSGFYVNCVSAEAQKLAISEIQRLEKDAKMGRISNEKLEKIQKSFIGYLGSSNNLCSDTNKSQ